MKTIQLLTVTFDAAIAPYEIKLFRDSVLEKVGWRSDLYDYRYPLIQFKRLHRRAAIVFIDSAIDSSPPFLERLGWRVCFGPHQWSFYQQCIREHPIGVSAGQWHYYALSKWMALNSHNYRKFLIANTYDEQLELLNQVLANHIIAFAKHTGHRLEHRFEVQIADFQIHTAHFEGFQALTFDLTFKTQMSLPPSIGLGKAVGIGYGTVRHWQPEYLHF